MGNKLFSDNVKFRTSNTSSSTDSKYSSLGVHGCLRLNFVFYWETYNTLMHLEITHY